MAYLDKIKVNNTSVDVHDSRIVDIDTTIAENGTNPVTSGAVYRALGDIQSSLSSILGVTEIKFTIFHNYATSSAVQDEVLEYKAQDGMTWEEWVSSKYNIVESSYTAADAENNGNWYINGANEVSFDSIVGAIQVQGIGLQDVIVANCEYEANHATNDF